MTLAAPIEDVSAIRAVDVIRKKRDGLPLSPMEIEAFVHGATIHQWPDYQQAALLMAIVLRGMNRDETAHLTAAMARSGATLDWSDVPGVKVDKHSTGGVGDKTSLVLVPLVASCGVIVPKMSGRSLAHTGGTLDKLESIPGFRAQLPLDELHAVLRQVGCVLVGQTAEIAPADKILYSLRDVTATVESIPLITASILSKKLAEGIDALVLDVKCGRGAFMKTLADAHQLAEELVTIGNLNGLKTRAFVTSKDAPLGQAVGNAVEVIEAIETLKGRGPADLLAVVKTLARGMLILAGVSADEAETRIETSLSSGQALDKFRQMIQYQGGDPRVLDDYSLLPRAPRQFVFKAPHSGYLREMDAELIGRATMLLGAGRQRVEDPIDHGVGAVLLAKRGAAVRQGDGLIELHYADETRLAVALPLLEQACVIRDDAATNEAPVILDEVD
ncbi:MAG: thymidine phosphorylase [Gemmataceae bacterium]